MGPSRIGWFLRQPGRAERDGGAAALTYLLDVVFADYADDAAPVTTPIVGRVSGLDVIDAGNTLSIASGELVIASGSGADLNWSDGPAPRAAGLTAFAQLKPTSAGSDKWKLGWVTNDLFWIGSTGITISATGANIGAGGSAYRDYAVIQRNAGAYFFIDGKLVWVNVADTMDRTFDNSKQNAIFEGAQAIVRIADLIANGYAALGTRDLDLCVPGTGNGTSSIASPAAGNTFAQTDDAYLHWTFSAVPGSGTGQFDFRSDGTNYLRLYFNLGSNYFNLWKYIDGEGLSNVASYNVTLQAGDDISIVCNGDTISGFVNDNLAWSCTITDAVLLTGTAGDFQNLGGFTFSNFTARTLDGVANVAGSNHPGYGVATGVWPGPLTVDDGVTQEASADIRIKVSGVPITDTTGFYFAYDSTSQNGYRLLVLTTGRINLYRVTSGSATLLTFYDAVAGSSEIAVQITPSAIKVYLNNTLAITNTDTTYRNGETVLYAEDSGGTYWSDLVTRPFDPASAPNTPAAASIQAAQSALATV